MRALALAAVLVATPMSVWGHEDVATGTDYTPWKKSGGGSCCNNKDCHQVDLCILPDDQGVGFVPPSGGCYPVPYDKIIDPPTPFTGAHWCGYMQHFSDRSEPVTHCFAMESGA